MKKIIMLDIDGTLYDYNYNVNSLKLKDYFKKNKENVYVLNSNRSFEDIKIVQKEFELDSIIIAENGCLVYVNSQEYVLTKNKPAEEYFDIIKKIIYDCYSDAKVLILDTVNWIKNEERVEDGLYFLVNEFRKYSFSIHVKRVLNGKAEKEFEVMKIISKEFERNAELNKYFIIKSSNFGNILLNPKDCDKATGLSFIKEKFYPNNTFICIGDDSFDMILASKFDYFFAVNNADKEVKEKANKVSKYNFTLGVLDILENYIGGEKK